jgi:2',3'-cyclic-nucleotide 2'-phosphodiesterase (5'-nucleotidase family)
MKLLRRLLSFPALLFAFALAAGEMRIVVTTDLHGNLRNFAVLASEMHKHIDERTLTIDLGDTVPGTFASEYAENSSGMAEALNLVGTELWIPGNHDFALAPDDFRSFVRRFKGRVLGGDWRCAGVSGEAVVIVEKGGVRCAVIGLTDLKMPQRILPGADMEFRNPFAVLDECMKRVYAARPHVVVLAWHNGLYTKLGSVQEVLRRYPGIDLVLGGHSHQEIPGRRIGKKTLFVQPGAHGHAAGVVDITTDDATGKITRVTSKLIRGDIARPAPEIAALGRQLDLECRGLRDWDLGRCAPPRPGERNAELGKSSAEALRAAGNADAAAIWLGTRDRDRGGRQFTYGDLYGLLPHRNELCVLTVTRDELTKFTAEHDKLVRDRGYPQILFVAGMKVHRAGDGAITRIEAPEKLTLAVNDYLIADSSVLRPLAYRDDRNFRRLGVTERDAVAEYLAVLKNKRHNNIKDVRK